MNKFFETVLSVVLTAALSVTGCAAIVVASEKDYSSFSVSKTFGNDMVVQRNEQFRVWGTADNSLNGEKVTLSFMGENATTTVENGEWTVTYPTTLEACNQLGNDMTVNCGTKTVTFKDVLVGDVYMVVGQSNVAYTFSEAVSNSPEGYPGKDIQPDASDIIRLNNNGLVYQNSYPTQGSGEECKDIVANGGWQRPSFENVKDFTALGYFFAKQILEKTDNTIPIGLIEINGNGQNINTFIGNELAEELGIDEKDTDGIYKTNYNGTKMPSRFMYNHYMRPFRETAIAGMIWYQGESDFVPGSFETYNTRFKGLVEYMRNHSNVTNKEFPVFVVELPPMYNGTDHQFLPTSSIRSIMGLIPSQVSSCYIAATSDLWKDKAYTNNLHPYCKYPISERLASLAQTVVYKQGNIKYSAAPVFSSYELSDDRKTVTVRFKYVGNGLETYADEAVKGFLVNAATKPTSVTIKGKDKIVITSNEVITSVKYNAPNTMNVSHWYAATENSYPENINVSNSSSLPMVSFMIEVTPEGSSSGVFYGNVNDDSAVTTADALLVLQNAVNVVDFTDEQEEAADVNIDGNVNTLDALLVLQNAVGKIQLPVR